MSRLDATTLAEYEAESTASDRAQAIVDALASAQSPQAVTVRIRSGASPDIMATGTMANPWATQTNGVISVGELTTALDVLKSGTPDADWTIEFSSGSRWMTGTFGLAGSGKEFTWSLATFDAAQTATLGTVEFTSVTNHAPQWRGAPAAITLDAGGNYDFSSFYSDEDDDALIVTLVPPYESGYQTTSTGLMTAGSVSEGITLRVSDGALFADWYCAVTIRTVSATPDFIIPSSVSSWNAAQAQPRVAGGTAIPNTISGAIIELSGSTSTTVASSGSRGPLTIYNLVGTASVPMTIRNPAAGAVIISGATSFMLQISACRYVTVDGSNGGQTYGIRSECATSTSSCTSLIKFSGHCRYITMAHFSVDGKRTSWGVIGTQAPVTPIGMQMHENNLTPDGVTWQEGHVIRDFYIRRVAGEGIYCGPNYAGNPNAAPMRLIQIYDGIVEDTGRDGIQGKSWWGGSGTNAIHDIVCRRVGRNATDETGQRFGIDVTSGHVDIYNCTVVDAGETGIRSSAQNGPLANDNSTATGARGYGAIASFDVSVYNNLVVRAGAANSPATGNGISIGAIINDALAAGDNALVYNNTCVNCEAAGVRFESLVTGGTAQNNILLDNGSATSNGSGATINNNLTTGTQSDIFVAPGSENYHLKAEQAVTAGLKSSFDIEGKPRSGTASKGAYEYT